MKRREFLANAALAFALTTVGKIVPAEEPQAETYGRSPSAAALPDIKAINKSFARVYARNVETLIKQKGSRLRDHVRSK